jgi:hypothetical protein
MSAFKYIVGIIILQTQQEIQHTKSKQNLPNYMTQHFMTHLKMTILCMCHIFNTGHVQQCKLSLWYHCLYDIFKGTQNLYHFWPLTGLYSYLGFVVASGRLQII